MLKQYIALALMLVFSLSIFAQETKKDVNKLTRDEVLEMTIEDLSNYDLEEIMKIMDVVGASTIEELYELLLNKDVTSASKSEESLFDSPLSTTVLSHDQILASGATCFEEALRMVPGVIVREKTNGNFDVHIRGNDNLPSKNMLLYSENSQTLVMINGRPVFNYSHGGTLWESLPISFEDVDRIEVVRGPSSALYGPNAVSGVINIITANITKDTPLVSGNIKAGNMNSYIGDIAFRKQINDKLGFGITANYETRDRETDKILIYNGYYDEVNGITKYVLDGKRVGTGYYSTEEMKRLQLAVIPDSDDPSSYFSVDEFPNPRNNGEPFMIFPDEGQTGQLNGYDITIYDTDDIFPHPEQSKERYAVNGYVELTPNTSTNISVSGGYQHSDVLTSTMGDMPTPYSGKVSKTSYIDLRANIKDFSFQTNFNGGDIDFMSGNEGFELDLRQYNATAEYNLKLDKIAIRPGLNYQHISYDDSPYISTDGRGYLNGKKDIEIMAGSLRLDYKPTDKLRLIAALRTEKYNHPDDFYTSWQLIGSYKINDNNLFRVVYSRANQSSFLVNAHSNYTWNLINRPYPRVMQFSGNKEYDLMTTDMVELGYRVRPAKNVLIDFEAFYNISDGFGALSPDYVNLNIVNPAGILTQGAAPVVLPDSVHMQYNNLELESKQLGLSVNVDWVISEKLIANAHFTYQKTKLDNYLGVSRDELIGILSENAAANTTLTDAATAELGAIGYGLATGAITPSEIPATVFYSESSTLPSNYQNDYDHKSTPSYFGGFSLTYRPIEKLEILPNAYFYGDQTFENQYGTIDIDSKFIFNTTVNYKATDKLTFSLTGKNLFGNDSNEFAFMDNIPTMVFAGVNFKF